MEQAIIAIDARYETWNDDFDSMCACAHQLSEFAWMEKQVIALNAKHGIWNGDLDLGDAFIPLRTESVQNNPLPLPFFPETRDMTACLTDTIACNIESLSHL